MEAEVVTRIQKLAQEALAEPVVEVDGEKFSKIHLHEVPRPHLDEPVPLKVSSLQAVADYLNENRDALALEEVTVHVQGPTQVSVISELRGDRRQRFTYLEARARGRLSAATGFSETGFSFGRFLELEDMNIALQHLFLAGYDRPRLLKLIGNVKGDTVNTQADDGVTQTVTVKGGVHLVGETEIANPFELAPFRTFLEVEQPASPFVLRARKGQAGVQVALFEADGGAWEMEAVTRIRAWLKDVIPTGTVLLG